MLSAKLATLKQFKNNHINFLFCCSVRCCKILRKVHSNIYFSPRSKNAFQLMRECNSQAAKKLLKISCTRAREKKVKAEVIGNEMQISFAEVFFFTTTIVFSIWKLQQESIELNTICLYGITQHRAVEFICRPYGIYLLITTNLMH